MEPNIQPNNSEQIPRQDQPSPKRFNKKVLATIGVVFVVLVASGVGAFFVLNDNEEQIVDVPEEKEPVVVDETVDWLTYKNEEFGFEVKIPEDWVIIEPQGDQKEFYGVIINFQTSDTETLINQGKLSLGSPNNLVIYTVPIVSGDSVKDLMLKNSTLSGDVSIIPFFDGISRIKIGNTSVDGREAYEYIIGGYGTSYAILVNNNGEFYSLAFTRTPSKEQLPKIEKAVLSTFKFFEIVVQKEIEEAPFFDPCGDAEFGADYGEIDCYLEVGKQYEDIDICNKLEGTDKEDTAVIQGSCYGGVAIAQEIFPLCLQVGEEQREKACVFAFAYASGKIEKCDFLPTDTEQQFCIGVVVAKRGLAPSAEECMLFRSSETRQVCNFISQ